MATSESRRRKQLEKKKKKRSEKQHQLLVRRNAGLAEQLQMKSKWPIHECLIGDAIHQSGIGAVSICRRSASGELVMGLFLIDRYCMGVKDCFGRVITAKQYREFKEEQANRETPMRTIDPASARRMVEDAVAYANGLGLKPHVDYRAVRMIFGDIDASQATTLLEMGLNGKPHFVRGPFESAADCQMIVNKLTEVCGPNGFHYTMAIGPGTQNASGFDFNELSFDDDDDELNVIEYDENLDDDESNNVSQQKPADTSM